MASLPGRTVPRHLFGLAPAGVYHAACVTADAVGSYPTISPLPWLVQQPRRFVFCGTIRHILRYGVSPHLVCAQVLPGSLSKEPGLSSIEPVQTILSRPPCSYVIGSNYCSTYHYPSENDAVLTTRSMLWESIASHFEKPGCHNANLIIASYPARAR